MLNFDELEENVRRDIESVSSDKELEAFRIRYLGRKGLMTEVYQSLSSASADEKPFIGKRANVLKKLIQEAFENKQSQLKSGSKASDRSSIDVTLPGMTMPVGSRHILSQTMDEICQIFERLGFSVQEGPEAETEYNNFTALNIPDDHPSRDGFDTFYLDRKPMSKKDGQFVLRSHTSPGQIRIMQEHKPPLAIVLPGKVYRPDAVDASHSFMFHQIEGLLVDKDVKFSHLKGLLTEFCHRLFGKDIKMRFRPHFFPFTEPSAEVDISWKAGKKKWLEIMGCGMVHPDVFVAAGYPRGKYTGLAFGLGVDRIAMLKYGIKDIRLFYENDKRFLEEF